MDNFIKLFKVKEKKLKEEEMKRVKGGEKTSAAIDPIEPPVMPLHYGIIPPDPPNTLVSDDPIPTCN